MQVFDRQVSARGLATFGFETALISGAVIAAASLHGSAQTALSASWKIAVVTAVCELCFYYNDLYDLTIVGSPTEFVLRLLRAAGIAAMLIALTSLVVPELVIGRGVFLTWLILLVLSVSGWRLAFERLSTHLEERLLIVGTGLVAQRVVAEIQAQRDFAYRVVGCVEDSESPGTFINAPILGMTSDLPALVESHRIDRIVVGLSDRRHALPIQELMQAKLAGVRVEDAATTYERIAGKILAEGATPSWFVFSDGFRTSRRTRFVKRTVDLVLAFVGLVLSAPLMVLTALAIRLDSRGPVLYCQERVGEHGRTFTLCKFRSMRTDAEHGVPRWATENDDRVTRVGRFIRLTRLDEMPQLWNVLRGEMSFVGPRPERPYFVQQLTSIIPYYAQRHAVKPGVTGWAQVKYRYGSSIEDAMEKLRYDLYYIKHQSIFFDLTIFMDTVKVILTGKGAQ
jgi:sugar transferase (PEP-CTERM system associated)